MKKFMYFLLFVVSFGLISCNGLDTGAIKGHTFAGYDDAGDYMKIIFKQDNTCRISISAGRESVDMDAFTYTATETEVHVYYDTSSNWKTSVQGDEVLRGIYYSNSQELKVTSPLVYGSCVLKRIK